MAVLISAIRWPTEGRLEREAVYQVELAPHDDAGSGLTSLLNDEVAAVEAKVIRVLTE